MEQFVGYIVKNLVSNPEAVTVSCKEENETFQITIEVDPSDVGKVIGKKGGAINALRTIVRTVAARLQRRAQVELIQPEKPAAESVHVETAEPESAPAAETVAEEVAVVEEEAVAEAVPVEV